MGEDLPRFLSILTGLCVHVCGGGDYCRIRYDYLQVQILADFGNSAPQPIMASTHDQLVYSYSPLDGCGNFSCVFTIYYTKNTVWDRYKNTVCVGMHFCG